MTRNVFWSVLVSASMSVAAASVPSKMQPANAARYLVQDVSVKAAREDLESVGAGAERVVGIINAVSARLNPWQLVRLSSLPGVHVYADRALTTRAGLLGSIVSTATSTVSNAVSGALVTTNQLPLVSSLTTAVVSGASGNSVPQDGTGENTPTLLYQTNYPMLVGADTLQQAGITGAGVTIAMLDSGLWQALESELWRAHPGHRSM